MDGAGTQITHWQENRGSPSRMSYFHISVGVGGGSLEQTASTKPSFRNFRIGISCLFPASWHFSISPVGCPRILNTNLRQIVVVSILAAAVSLLYFSVVIIRNKYGRLSRDKKFQK